MKNVTSLKATLSVALLFSSVAVSAMDECANMSFGLVMPEVAQEVVQKVSAPFQAPVASVVAQPGRFAQMGAAVKGYAVSAKDAVVAGSTKAANGVKTAAVSTKDAVVAGYKGCTVANAKAAATSVKENAKAAATFVKGKASSACDYVATSKVGTVVAHYPKTAASVVGTAVVAPSAYYFRNGLKTAGTFVAEKTVAGTQFVAGKTVAAATSVKGAAQAAYKGCTKANAQAAVTSVKETATAAYKGCTVANAKAAAISTKEAVKALGSSVVTKASALKAAAATKATALKTAIANSKVVTKVQEVIANNPTAAKVVAVVTAVVTVAGVVYVTYRFLTNEPTVTVTADKAQAYQAFVAQPTVANKTALLALVANNATVAQAADAFVAATNKQTAGFELAKVLAAVKTA